MRILKYLFLLLILFFIGLTVFVTTQKGEYDIIRSKVIKTPRATVFNYVNEFRNWETFASWIQEDAEIKLRYSKISSGKGASFSWKDDDGDGNMKTIHVKENESIMQKMVYNDSPSEVFWTFKDTLGATKVSWRTKGKMTAMMKIATFFKGGINSVIGAIYEKSLATLDRTLDYEMNTYAIKIDGIVNHPKSFYISQTINSYEKNVVKNIKILVPNMIHFFIKNKMVMSGKPFVIYNKTGQSNVVNFSVCAPIRDSIYIMPGSDVESGKIEAMTTLKTTLIGDYSHLKEAKSKAIAYLQKNQLKQNTFNTTIEVYSKTKLDIKNPSKWITELYIPIYPKAIKVKTVSSKPKDSVVTVPLNSATIETTTKN